MIKSEENKSTNKSFKNDEAIFQNDFLFNCLTKKAALSLSNLSYSPIIDEKRFSFPDNNKNKAINSNNSLSSSNNSNKIID